MYRVIVTLRSLGMELKKSNKKVISYNEIVNTMSFTMADLKSKEIVIEIVDGMRKENDTKERPKTYMKVV